MSTVLKTNSSNSNRIEVVLNSMDPSKSNPSDVKKLKTIRQTIGNFSLTSENHPVQILAIRIQDLYSQQIIGTLYARVLDDDTFSVDLLCVEEESRKRKIGSRLLELAENYAYQSKAKKITLCTYDFQAPEFYEKKGYRRVSHIKNALDHHTLIFFEKALLENPPPASDIDLYRNNLMNQEFSNEAPQNSHLERVTIARDQGASKNENCKPKPMKPKNDPLACYDIKDLLIEIYTKDDINEEKETMNHALQGILHYNLKILQAESKTERDFVEFALVVYQNTMKNRKFTKKASQNSLLPVRRNIAQRTLSLDFDVPPCQIPDSSNCFEKKDAVQSDQILGVVTGLLVTGSENSSIVVESLRFKNGCENNEDIHRQVLEGLEALGIEHKCLNLVPYDQVVQNAFDLLASSKSTQLTFRRITPL